MNPYKDMANHKIYQNAQFCCPAHFTEAMQDRAGDSWVWLTPPWEAAMTFHHGKRSKGPGQKLAQSLSHNNCVCQTQSHSPARVCRMGKHLGSQRSDLGSGAAAARRDKTE